MKITSTGIDVYDSDMNGILNLHDAIINGKVPIPSSAVQGDIEIDENSIIIDPYELSDGTESPSQTLREAFIMQENKTINGGTF
jgi:hypothetical protein